MNTTESRQRDWQLKDNPEKVCSRSDCDKTHRTTQQWCPDCRQGVPTTEINNASISVVYENPDIDGNVHYVGQGSIPRAHLFAGSSANRDPEHSRWIFEQLKFRSLRDVFKIIGEHLSRSQAKTLEQQHYDKLKEEGHPLTFNKERPKGAK